MFLPSGANITALLIKQRACNVVVLIRSCVEVESWPDNAVIVCCWSHW